MENINWENYNGPAFQLFCNALLSFELGNQFQPFNAPGKDGGIDGSFDGAYSGYTDGKWRFQYKFHKGARKQGAGLLKTDVKNETLNIGVEDYFILLTNVELSPQEKKGLEDIYADESAVLKHIPRFEVWDGAKLFTLYLKFPILNMWLTEGFSTAQLVDYKKSFEKLLYAPVTNGYTLGNYFASRESSLLALKNFIDSSDAVALISGEAGIGKTRLVIEFFKRIEKERKDVVCLQLKAHHTDFDKIKFALSGEQNYLLLVDDAQEFGPVVIADLTGIAIGLGPRVKLILTARTIQTQGFTTKLTPYEEEAITKIELGALSKPETLQLFDHELQGQHLHHYTNALTDISHGKPILIVSILAAATANTDIREIKNQEFFNRYVERYFDAYCKEVSTVTGMTLLKTQQLLQVVCMIEPFNYGDAAIIEKIGGLLKEEKASIAKALELLKAGGYVSGRHQHSIKPDYYSDILLRKASSDLIHNAVITLIVHIDHIITNLGSSDDVSDKKNLLLDEILESFIAMIAKPDNIKLVSWILETVISVTYNKPTLARKAVNIYVEGLLDKEHAIYKDFIEFPNFHTQFHDSAIGKIRTILWELLYLPDCFEFVYDTVFKLQAIVKEFRLLGGVYQFSKRDYIENYALKRQAYFISRLRRSYKSLPPEKCLLGIEFLKMFMQHDFTVTDTDAANRHSISIITYFLPNEPNVNNSRTSVIDLLVDMYKNTNDAVIKERLLAALIDIPRGIFATTRNKIIYEGNHEIEKILQFILAESPTLAASLQPEVLEKLYWFERWGIDEQFLPVISDIRLQLKPRNIREQLTQLFSNAELGDSDYQKADENVQAESRKIIQNNTAAVIAESLAEIQQQSNNKYYYFHQFIAVLSREFEAQAREVYNLLWSISKPFIYQWGGSFLHEQYFSFNNENFFREKVNELAALDNPEADNTILTVYMQRHASKITLREADFTIIETIFNKNQAQNNFLLARALVAYIFHNPDKGLVMGLSFLERCYDRQADTFFLFLSDNLPQVYPALRTLTLEGSIRFELHYNIEKCLNSILKTEGTQVVFDYLVQRFRHKQQIFLDKKSLSGYDLLPSPEHSHLCDGLPASTGYELFEKALRWWLTVPLEPIDYVYAKDLISYLQVNRSVDDTLTKIITLVAQEYTDNLKATGRVLDALAVYHEKDEALVNLVLLIYEQGYDLHGSTDEGKNKLNSKAFNAITEVGGKSGTAGQPFEVDVQLKQLLEERLTATDEFAPSYALLKALIKSLERTIASSYDNDNETW